MNERAPSARSWLTFVIAFVMAYYSVLWAALRLFDDALAAALPHALPFRTKALIAAALCPIVTAVFGSLLASLRVKAFVGVGSSRMTPGRFFVTGWMALAATNWVFVFVFARWVLPLEPGKRWLAALGTDIFNGTLLFAAPTIGFVCGIVAVAVVEQVAVAQRT